MTMGDEVRPRTSTNDFWCQIVQNSNLLLYSLRSRSALVKDPEPPSVPPTKKHRRFFSMNANGSPSTTVILEGGPAVTESLLPHQIPLPDTSDSDDETLFDHVDSNVKLHEVLNVSIYGYLYHVHIIFLSSRATWIFKIKLDEYGDVFKEQSSVSGERWTGETAFSMAELNEVVYVSQPEEIVDQASSACVPPQESSLWTQTSSTLSILKCTYCYKGDLSVPKGTIHRVCWYPKDSGFELKALQMLTMQDVIHNGEVLQVKRRTVADLLLKRARVRARARAAVRYNSRQFISSCPVSKSLASIYSLDICAISNLTSSFEGN
ncbi:hypothetical protein Tco_0992672 [Tanacetum coccineum]|uniref:Uncharacterized protein n=1 Tax=Tanacetum coccineum TaxID=301880 RepID=A0ABQ5F3G4_9ASTR